MGKLSLNRNKTMYRSYGSDERREKDLITLSVLRRREVLAMDGRNADR